MKGLSFFCMALLASSVAQPALAQDRPGGYYAGLQLTGSHAEIDDISTNGFGSFSELDTKDLVAGAGAVLGYQLRNLPFRTELEAGYRFRFDFDSRDNIGPVSDKSDIATRTVRYNVAYEYRNSTAFTPFAGATIGWARHFASTERNLQDSVVFDTDDEATDNLAYGGFVGVNWAFSENWSTEIAYRYLNLGEVKTGAFPTGESISVDNYSSDDFLITLRYEF